MATKKPLVNHQAILEQARLLSENKQWPEAMAAYQKLLKVFPKTPELLSEVGAMEIELGHFEKGLLLLAKSLALQPNQPAALVIRGVALARLNRLDKALASFDRALALNANDYTAYANKGAALHNLKRFNEALSCFDKAIALNPECATAYFNKAMLKLLHGEYQEGWRLFEWRRQDPQKKLLRKFVKQQWLGELPVADKRILIHTEQGFGDFIQFCRYVVLLAELAAKVIVEAPSAVFPLICSLKGQNITVIELGQPIPEYDLQLPIMSLPLAFKTTLKTIPAVVPYLYADTDKQRIFAQGSGNKTLPRIGLVWSGSTKHKNDSVRSIPLKQLAPLLMLPFEFHSLQKEIKPEELKTLAKFSGLHPHQHELHDFSDTAALIQEMDIVISVDTSVAHLAGALGKPVWILLQFVPDHRWLLDRTDSPWYPTATLFRQSVINDWDNVMLNVVNKLRSTFP